jgi:hypothetical protein
VDEHPSGLPNLDRTIDNTWRRLYFSVEMNRPLPNLVCCITASATFAGQKSDFEQFRDRSPWIWQTPRQVAPPKVRIQPGQRSRLISFVLRKLEAAINGPTSLYGGP